MSTAELGLTITVPDVVIEKIARAMALKAGWEKWDTATSCNHTLNGNEPDEEREHYRDLARTALEALGEPEELARKAAAYDAINTPEIADFLVAVENEALHQRDRWAASHDGGKGTGDWIALLVYLIGKATKAHYDGDRQKLLHHVITTAAACLNWHAAVLGTHKRMRPGVENDMLQGGAQKAKTA